MPVKVCVYVHRNRAKALSHYLGILKFELTVSPNEPTNMCNTYIHIPTYASKGMCVCT